MADYYVDPSADSSGDGSAGSPWKQFGTTEWSTVNTALGSADTTVYFSARIAGADTAEDLSAGIDIDKKTADPGNTLTLDGNSKYNTNESSPSWSAYSGSNRCIINHATSQNSGHTKYNDVVITGFKIVRTGSGKGVSIAGDNWVVQDCDISHDSGAGDGPLVYMVPTADAAHEGSSAYTPACDNILIDNCTIYDAYGEVIYVGGGGQNPGEAGSGYPSHTNITISDCTISNANPIAGEGDGIDVKGGIINLTITGNDISSIPSGARPIVTQGRQDGEVAQNMLIEKNYIHDCPNVTEGISLSDTWGVIDGITIRNNIIDTVNSEGIQFYSGNTSINVEIYNNTIYNCTSYAVNVQTGNSAIVSNNAFLNCNSGGDQVAFGGTVTHVNNAHTDTYGASGGTGIISGLSATAGVDVTDAAGGDFTIPDTDSKLYNAGVTIASVTDDYIGTARPQTTTYDVGAYELSGAAPESGGTSIHRAKWMKTAVTP